MKEKGEQRCTECKSNSVYTNTHNQLCCSNCGYIEPLDSSYDIEIEDNEDDDDNEIIPDIHPNCMEDYKSSIEGG